MRRRKGSRDFVQAPKSATGGHCKARSDAVAREFGQRLRQASKGDTEGHWRTSRALQSTTELQKCCRTLQSDRLTEGTEEKGEQRLRTSAEERHRRTLQGQKRRRGPRVWTETSCKRRRATPEDTGKPRTTPIDTQ